MRGAAGCVLKQMEKVALEASVRPYWRLLGVEIYGLDRFGAAFPLLWYCGFGGSLQVAYTAHQSLHSACSFMDVLGEAGFSFKDLSVP